MKGRGERMREERRSVQNRMENRERASIDGYLDTSLVVVKRTIGAAESHLGADYRLPYPESITQYLYSHTPPYNFHAHIGVFIDGRLCSTYSTALCTFVSRIFNLMAYCHCSITTPRSVSGLAM